MTDQPMPADAGAATAVLNAEPDWFKTAVFYEVLVRSFRDSNGDGTGDFKGLIEKLDYLEWLGVDCLWVPPFFTSPLRDGGYDVADYNDILPECGTTEDFHEFLDACHQRGIRVIIDFVMNHTSDAHPWFQASRSDPEGPYGDFYVWSDTDELYQDARVIFVDTEPSNWTWDPVRQQYFWHRFFHHQPDLNFDNPKVHDAMMEAMAFWLDMGLDGFRLDAVPYLYERPGTNGENLPETHEFLKKCRRFVDDNYPGRVLLCEANQWPADVVEYFGPEQKEDGSWVGTECHMAFHFPVMPRIFMAVRRESRFPISEILEQTPAIPEGCQWGIFLRNHDELTLEMVTDEDRDYMWSEYAHDPRMKANIGIRRRLAPLLDNDVNRMELFTALLLSLPGSPVLYYGDEIGMGDNIWLGDRDGVRTPMQWTPDRNAGFSSATPGKLHLPAVQDPIYGYQSVNVEAQLENTSSLLHWTRRLVHARRRHPAFGLGTFVDLGGSNPSVLSYIREHDGPDGARRDPLRQQPLALPAAGRARPAPVGGHGARRAARRRAVPGGRRAPLPADARRLRLPVATTHRLRDRVDAVNGALQSLIAEARWFGGKGRDWSLTGVRRVGELPDPQQGLHVAIELAEVSYSDGDTELYQLPLAYYAEPQDRIGHAWVGEWDDADFGHAHVYDALHDRESMALWLRAFAAAQGAGSPGLLAFHRLPGHEFDLEAHSTLFSGEQSNSSVAFGEDSLMKVFRKVTPGVNPDIAIHQVLTEAGSEHVASLYGWLDLVDDEFDTTIQLAMLQQFLRTATDGWELALSSVRNLFAEADLHADEVGGDFAGEAARLGVALAEVHADLAEHFPSEDSDRAAVVALADAMDGRLDAALAVVPALAEHEAELRSHFDALRALDHLTVQQVHGDLHLGQTLRTVKGWKIVDFEGEPAKPLAVRLLPDSVWRDVAGMIRSFDYAPRVVALTGADSPIGPEAEQRAYRAAEWAARNRAAFLEAYATERGTGVDPDADALLAAYLADKIVYEAVYEARNRPGWVSIPLAALGGTS